MRDTDHMGGILIALCWSLIVSFSFSFSSFSRNTSCIVVPFGSFHFVSCSILQAVKSQTAQVVVEMRGGMKAK